MMPGSSRHRDAIRRHIRIGWAVVVLLLGAVGAWAATTEIAGAVVAFGSLVVDSNVKQVQHPTGGVVGEIHARNGDKVKAGDILVRLDETVARANLAIIQKGLHELLLRKARLEAERNEDPTLRLPRELRGAANDPEIADLVSSERKVLELRLSVRHGQKSLLAERNAQLREQINGHEAQKRGKIQEIALIQRELVGARDLWSKDLMPITKLTALEREAARLEGERAQLQAAIAQAKGRISEIELQILQIDREAGSDASRELRDVDAKIGELIERRTTAEDHLRRIDIRAPQDGIVHQSIVHTVGGVVSPGETLMLIVPGADRLIAEVRVAPQDIDQLWQEQIALLRFPALNQRTTPELSGSVSHISADITSDPRTGLSYYAVRIAIPLQELPRLGDVRLVPGMPIEAFIKTGDRRVISYLVKPLQDQIMRAFRER